MKVRSQDPPRPILITGFDPAGRVKIEPSALLALALDGEFMAGRPVLGRILPAEIDALAPQIDRLIELHDPDLIIAFGGSETAERFRLETTAYNAGTDGPLTPGGPAEIQTALAVPKIHGTLTSSGFDAEISSDPGRQLCNAGFYFFGLRRPAGFIQVPLLPNSLDDGKRPSHAWPFLTQLSAALCVIDAALEATEKA